MDRAGKKCILYSRVSTEMQVDGFSLAGQKTCLTSFAKREEMKIIGEYEDAGKSGKSIEGRPAFKRMLNDIKEGLQVDYIIVYKLSRFGRNAADVLNSLEIIQDYGVNLICTDEGIDSSQASGRLLISVLSAVAQIERENILEQTMNGRREKARQGLWNGGQAPYGYDLKDGKLVINEEEAKIVRMIYDMYVHTPISMRQLAIYLNNQKVEKKLVGNRKDTTWIDSSMRKIIGNPVYNGKIEWGHRKNMKQKGSKEMKRVYTHDNIIVSKGAHEAIIDDETWEKALTKKKQAALKFNNKVSHKMIHPLTGLIVCPECGRTMGIGLNKKTNLDGETIRQYYYHCNNAYRKDFSKTTCNHKRVYNAECCEKLVRKAISKIVVNEQYIESLKKEFTGVDTSSKLSLELENYERKLKSLNTNKNSLESEIDNLDADAPNYEKKRETLNIRLNKVYDNVFEVEDKIEDVKKKIKSIESQMISADLIINALKSFDEMYDMMTEEERKIFLKSMIKKIEFTERTDEFTDIQLKSISFNFPVFKDVRVVERLQDADMDETIKELPAQVKISSIEQRVEFGSNENQIELESLSPYKERIIKEKFLRERVPRPKKNRDDSHHQNNVIMEYVWEKYNLKVYAQIIRFVKAELGMYVRRLKTTSLDEYKYHISHEKWDAVVDALTHFELIPDEILANLEELNKQAYEKLDILNSKIRAKKGDELDRFVAEIRKETGLKITARNVIIVKDMLGIEKHIVYSTNGNALSIRIPVYEKSKAILEKLIKENNYPNAFELRNKLEQSYEEIKKAYIKRNPNNNDIIDYVKEKYDLVVNPSMISYVRDKLGVCVKQKDKRYDPSQKNKRIPTPDKYDAIVEAMNVYGMIA